jgi:hypothetical protein
MGRLGGGLVEQIKLLRHVIAPGLKATHADYNSDQPGNFHLLRL